MDTNKLITINITINYKQFLLGSEKSNDLQKINDLVG